MQLKNPVQAVARVLFFNAPVDAQLIITRRCNLSCGYCSEYDNSSEPVPLEELRRRIDALHRLRAANITLLGGEPLMHPQVAEIVEYAGRRSNTSVVTNGFLLRPRIIEQLNEAGLNNLTISIDTVSADPTRYIQKSLRSLRPKLERLKRLAKFDVHVTAVLCESSKGEFKRFVDEINGLGLRMSVNLIHNGKGQVTISGQEYVDLLDYFYEKGQPFTFTDYSYNKKLLQGERPTWQCRAGARYPYVDEFGQVQLCASQVGRLGKPIEEYTPEDMKKHSRGYKGCEEGCSVGCAYRCSLVDNDKAEFLKALLKGYLRGTIWNNGTRPKESTSIKSDQLPDPAGLREE